ncbi:hypothetical protein J7L87_03665 [bacterium]|nr:hypothetical protein [bacterium]
MKEAIFYPAEEIINYILVERKEKREGKIEKTNLEKFIEDEKISLIELILPKKDFVFRKITFDFPDLKKIKLILPGEIEDILPQSLDNFLFHYEFFKLPEKKTAVNIYGIKKEIYNFWKNLSDKYKFKLLIYPETVLLHIFLKERGENFFGAFITKNYFSIILVENGILSGAYSSSFNKNKIEDLSSFINPVLSSRNYPVYVCGDIEIFEKIGFERDNIQFIKREENSEIFFPSVLHQIKTKPFKFTEITFEKKFPVFSVSATFIFLIISGLLISSNFKLKEKEKELEEIKAEMVKTFKSTCPEVKRIVEPLVQIKEKIAEIKTEKGNIGIHPEILDVMKNLTLIIPDDVKIEINEFNFSKGNLSISGKIGSLKQLEKIKEKMSSSEFFSDVKMGSVSFDPSNRVNFNLSVKVKK